MGRKRDLVLTVVKGLCAAVLAVSWAHSAKADSTERVSVSSAEVQDNTGASSGSYITPDGRFVVFYSSADNLVPGDTNNVGDVFVRDRLLGTTTRVSVPDPGVSGGPTQANQTCFLGRSGVRYCSDDGRHVVFESSANNLVNNDTNGDNPPFHISGADIFVRDRDVDGNGVFDEAGVGKTRTARVSVTSGESQYIEFSVGLDTYGGGCHKPSISADGRYVAFLSEADNLGGTGTIGNNIYRRDRDHDQDGIFDESGNGTICDPLCHSVDASITEIVSKVRCCSGQQGDGYCDWPAISGNGRYVAFVTASQWLDYDLVFDSDTNSDGDVYVRDMEGQSMRVSVDSAENQNTDWSSTSPSIDHDGRYIAFTTASAQLSASDTNGDVDVYVRDRGAPIGGDFIFSAGSTYRVSLGTGFLNPSVQLTSDSFQPAISANGRYVAFVTVSPVICGLFGCFDSNGLKDVFVRDTVNVGTTIASQTAANQNANGDSESPSVADNGEMVSFAGTATDMVAPDANGAGSDVYVRFPSSTVVGRHVFYNNSYWDGNNPGVQSDNPTTNHDDDNDAIATDKTALLPGGTAGFANYISFDKSITGIMVDIAPIPGGPAVTATAADFVFQVGNATGPAGWSPAPAPSAVVVTPGGGVSGSDRVTITWATNAIPNTRWLRVTVLANGNTSLGADDVHYWGIAKGESNSLASNQAVVSSTDELAARNATQVLFPNHTVITNLVDYNRDSYVNSTDQLVSRSNNVLFPSALKLTGIVW